jgi:hypothetical protein
MYTERWWGDLEQRDILKDVVIDGRIILESVLKNTSSGSGRGNVLQGRD